MKIRQRKIMAKQPFPGKNPKIFLENFFEKQASIKKGYPFSRGDFFAEK